MRARPRGFTGHGACYKHRNDEKRSSFRNRDDGLLASACRIVYGRGHVLEFAMKVGPE